MQDVHHLKSLMDQLVIETEEKKGKHFDLAVLIRLS